MSHYTPMHARDGQRRDAWRAAARDTWTRLRRLATLEFHLEFWLSPWGPDWWDWEWVQAHWYRQFKRADRKAFRAECEEIRARAILTPAPDMAPVQEKPRPGDHQRRASAARSGPGQPQAPGAVADGTGTSAGDSPPPAAALPATPSGESAANLPRPVPGPPAGRAGAARPAWVIFPDDRAMVVECGSARVRELGWEGHSRETGGMPALVRPAYARHEARRDSTARWGA